MKIEFCYSGIYNDHYAYPRSLVDSPPLEWSYRETDIDFNLEIGRPWANFSSLPNEWIHASSLFPGGTNFWVFDIDHIEYIFEQIRSYRHLRHQEIERPLAERLIIRSLSSPYLMGVIAWSISAKQSIEGLFAKYGLRGIEDICVAYPSVIPPIEVASTQELSFIGSLQSNLSPNCIVLLAIDSQPGVCEIEGRKNINSAVQCHNILSGQGIDAHLVLVSNKYDNYSFSEKIHFLPRLSRSALWNVYSLADIFLFLTRADATGFALLEAMYHGLCCIAADAPSSPFVSEVIEDGVTGFKVKFKNPAAYPQFSRGIDLFTINKILVRLVMNPETRKNIGNAAKSQFKFNKKFSVDVRNLLMKKHIYRRYESFLKTHPTE